MTGDVTCRMIRPGEEQEVFRLVERGFDEFVRDDCTPEGVAEFMRATRSMVFDRPPRHFLMVAESDGRIVGMIDVKGDSHICLFFVDSGYQGRGIGRKLLDQAVALCAGRRAGLSEMDVHSSLWAIPVYEKLGFEQTEPEQESHGIRFVEMVKKLEPQGA
jgi:GNAT superfamily N-acetyltransferase